MVDGGQGMGVTMKNECEVYIYPSLWFVRGPDRDSSVTNLT